MTDFFTHCWKSARARLLLVLLGGLLTLALPDRIRAQPAAADVTGLRVERTDTGWYLSATVNFELASSVEDALLKGIPMYFVAEAEVLRDRWYWYDRQVGAVTRHMRLAFQPLTRKWRLSMSSEPLTSSGLGMSFSQQFESLPEALGAIQRISRWKIAEHGDVDPDARHNVDFRFRLDLTHLPRPFQIGAVGHADWTIAVSRNVRLPTGISR